MLAPFQTLRAAAASWKTTAASGTFNTASNWTLGTVPVNGDSLTFSTSTTTLLTNNLTSLSVAGITFSGTGSSAFTISGNALTLTSTVSQANNVTPQTINAPLVLGANILFSATTNATLNVGGAVSGGFRLTKGNPGTLVLSGVNTHSGGTQVNAGTLQLSGSGTLGSSSGTLTINNGTLDLNGTSQQVGNFTGSSGTIVNNASGTAATLTFGNGNGTGGTVASVIANNASGTGTVALAKTGTGSIALSGANTFSGGTTINAGTLTLGSATTLSGATGLLAISGGTLATSVSATTIGGNLTLSSGTISLNGTGAGSLTLASGAVFAMSGGTFAFTLGSSFDQVVSAGSGTLSLTGGTFSFDTGGSGFSYASSYQIFSGFGSASFSALTLAGYDTANYTAMISDTGLLSFSASAIPEPSTYAAFAGAAALGLAAWRRRRA